MAKQRSNRALRGATGAPVAGIAPDIDELAFRAALVALDAAFEAANAGEPGRRFAAVAAQVGRLARRSAVTAGAVETGLRAGDTEAAARQGVDRVAGLANALADATHDGGAGVERIHRALLRMGEPGAAQAGVAGERRAADRPWTGVDAERDRLER